MSLLPDRAARAFPLILLGLMAGLALMLDRATELPEFAPSAANRTPDLSIRDFAALSYGPDGKPLYRLQATRMLRYPNDGRTEFQQAALVRTLPDAPTLTIVADKARANANGDQVWFEQAVSLRRSADAQGAIVSLTTSRLQLDTRNGLASSDAPTVLNLGGDRARTTGFLYDHDKAQLKLRANVSIDYAPPKS